EDWGPMPAGDVIAGNPMQQGFNYFTDATGRLSAGVWACTPMTTKPGPYSVNEFMLILEGAVTIVCQDGSETTVRAGESFVIPKGLHCSWQQSEPIRKIYVIFDDPSGMKPADPDALEVIKLSPKGPAGGLEPVELPDLSLFEGTPPSQHLYTYFTDLTGQLTAGVWTCSPMTRKVIPFTRSELMCLLEGAVTIIDGEGREQHFKAGDAVLIPQGMDCGWRSEVPVRKFYCSFEPSEAAEATAAAQ
ncbi:MAG: cupin domain-containing protein, partial [Kiloniellales bacterium]